MGQHDFEAPPNWKGFREVSGASFDICEPEEKRPCASFKKGHKFTTQVIDVSVCKNVMNAFNYMNSMNEHSKNMHLPARERACDLNGCLRTCVMYLGKRKT